MKHYDVKLMIHGHLTVQTYKFIPKIILIQGYDDWYTKALF